MALNATELARITIDNAALDGQGLPVVLVRDDVGIGGGLTDAELRAAAVPVSVAALPLPAGAATQGTLLAIAQQLADLLTELGQKLEPGGSIAVSNLPASQAVTGPLTDTQLRATAVAISGALTDTQLRAAAVPISHAAFDVALSALKAGTDRIIATPATEAKQDAGNASLVAILAELVALALGQGIAATSAVGPMVQGVVSDTPPLLLANTVEPVSMTTDGRLRVSSVPSTSMTDFWSDPFGAAFAAATPFGDVGVAFP